MDLEMLLRRIIREETGLTPVSMAEKWRGGEMVLRPGRPGLQDKSWPIESFFHKVVMLRNRLRVLEQQINGADVPEDLKIKLQGYITGCYGTLTSFNILFAATAPVFWTFFFMTGSKSNTSSACVGSAMKAPQTCSFSWVRRTARTWGSFASRATQPLGRPGHIIV